MPKKTALDLVTKHWQVIVWFGGLLVAVGMAKSDVTNIRDDLKKLKDDKPEIVHEQVKQNMVAVGELRAVSEQTKTALQLIEVKQAEQGRDLKYIRESVDELKGRHSH